MQEYLLIVRRTALAQEEIESAVAHFTRYALLAEQRELRRHSFAAGRGLLLLYHTHDYQGPSLVTNSDGFTLLVGYLIHEYLGGDHERSVARLHERLVADRAADMSWLTRAFGEFQVLHATEDRVSIRLSPLMTHAAYYSVGPEYIAVSNRAGPATVWRGERPAIDLHGQLELIAFDSFLADRTAYADVSTVPRGKWLELHLAGEGALWELHDDDLPWAVPGPRTLDETVAEGGEVARWLVEQLRLFTTQVRTDRDMEFGLSGGKDSRMLLSIFVHAGMMDLGAVPLGS